MPPGARKATILVVEDDSTLRAFYRTALTVAGYAVVTAEDGVDALHRIEAHQPSAIVLDLGLPRLRGEDVGRELAAHPELSDIPVIVVTGEQSDLDPASYACILRKPVTTEALISSVETCLRRSAPRRPAAERAD